MCAAVAVDCSDESSRKSRRIPDRFVISAPSVLQSVRTRADPHLARPTVLASRTQRRRARSGQNVIEWTRWAALITRPHLSRTDTGTHTHTFVLIIRSVSFSKRSPSLRRFWLRAGGIEGQRHDPFPSPSAKYGVRALRPFAALTVFFFYSNLDFTDGHPLVEDIDSRARCHQNNAIRPDYIGVQRLPTDSGKNIRSQLGPT